MKQFLQHFDFGHGLWRFAIDGLKDANNEYRKDLNLEIPPNREVYFAPARYKTAGTEKVDVLGSVALWADVDNVAEPPTTLIPPSFIVRSGHGYHLYWLLVEPVLDLELLEYLNKVVMTDCGDNVDNVSFNANRVLRVPGSVNKKDPTKPVRVELRLDRPAVKYHPQDIQAIARLDTKTSELIKTGSAAGYRSRSERDWAVVTDMVACGVSYEACALLFGLNPIGDKLVGDDDKYLKHTYEGAAKQATDKSLPQKTNRAPIAGKRRVDAQEIVPREDGFYKGDRRLSSFTFEPTLLLDATSDGAEDAIVGIVRASGYRWNDVTFSRTAFTSLMKFDRECPVAAWQWTGYDPDLRALLPWLMEQLRAKGLPRVRATPTMGLHSIDGEPYFIGDAITLSADNVWPSYKGPIAWLPSKKEHPKLQLTVTEPTDEVRRLLTETLPLYNDAEVSWPMIGWYAATPFKPWLEARNRRFPILNVTGTRGSGKSTLIQKVLMPLLGQVDPKSFDSGTTRFVSLALLGVTNAVPISFSEYRQENNAGDFLRYVRLAYDTGHDPRGRPDQTTVDYPLSAPFSVDGEDPFTDPACQERALVAQLRPASTREGTEAFQLFTATRDNIPRDFAGYYIQQCLKRIKDGRADSLLDKARKAINAAFPMVLPDRVRNNHIVAQFGAEMWCDVLGVTAPAADTMRRSVASVANLGTGKSRTTGDSFVEAVVDEVNRTKTSRFRWHLEGDVLYFQMVSAHNWWYAERQRQRRGVLEMESIRNQITEASYYEGNKPIAGALMYGINLPKAKEVGLDIVDHITVQSMEVLF